MKRVSVWRDRSRCRGFRRGGGRPLASCMGVCAIGARSVVMAMGMLMMLVVMCCIKDGVGDVAV